ncbi:MAG TPA: TPM domain-containing protein [Candidatus Acidoferrales bacterium]|jgi:uncharacterized protein|nr:TPM domain-containing protein [Candidatus Acidoferrales bacterium]
MLFVLCVPAARAEQVKNLKPQGYVNDFAGVLNSETRQKLTELCGEVERKTQAQIAVVTISSLEGVPVEQFANDLFTEWGIGPKDSKRGVLILVAPADHKYRIEVGYGLEPILPDGKVGGFGREVVPFLRQNDYSGAVLLMTQRVAAVIAADQNVTLDALSGVPPAPRPSGNSSSPYQKLFLVFYIGTFLLFPLLGFLLRLLFGIGRPRGNWRGGGSMGGPYYGGGPWGGGGGGGDSGGFGGFGGGSSGGGGASGSW